jgi:signal peptide peptidase SppA
MSKKNILLAITSGVWLIDYDYALASHGIVKRILAGEPAYNDESDDEEVKFKSAFSIGAEGSIAYGSKYNRFENASPNSTAVIGISGPIMKYDNCGDPGTKTYAAILDSAKRNPNISSVVLVIDSPGGTVDGTVELANYVKNFSKPIVAYVDGLMASAAYWIGSGAKEIVANNYTANIGSIGTMLSFADAQPMWEKEGVKFHYITADASVDKNKDFLEARKGNYDLVKQKLNSINDGFLAAVKDNRANKLNLKKHNVLTGKVYLAEEALEAGLIDSINSFDYAVQRARDLANGIIAEPEPIQSKTETQNNMKKITLLASQVALLALCGASIAEGENSTDVELTDELIDKINSALADASATKSSLDTVTEKLTQSESKVTSLEASVAEKNTEIETLNAKVRNLENPGATSSHKKGEEQVSTKEDANDFRTVADDEVAAMRKRIYGE